MNSYGTLLYLVPCMLGTSTVQYCRLGWFRFILVLRLWIHTLLLFNLQSREKASSRSGFIRIYTVPMVSSARDPRSLSILCCTWPYDSSMWTSTRINNDMRTTLPRRRATGASRRREHGPYFTQISAGVLRRSDGAQDPPSRSWPYSSTRFYIDQKL